MANRKEKELVKLKKVFSIGSLAGLIITGLIIIFAFMVMLQLFGKYVVDTKIRDEQSRINDMADVYARSENGGNKDILAILDDPGNEYVIIDQNGEVKAQHGNNTCDVENGGRLLVDAFDFKGVFSVLNFRIPDDEKNIGGSAQYKELQDEIPDEIFEQIDLLDSDIYVYPDTEFRILVPGDDGNIRVDYGLLKKTFENRTQADAALVEEGSIEKFPYWIDVPLADGTHFAGKAYFTVYLREFIVLLALLMVISVLSVVLLICLLVFIIKAFRNLRRMDRIFFEDEITGGKNWLWFYKNAGNIIRKRSNADRNFAVLDIEFVNYRNFCVCHSVAEGEMMLRLVDQKIRERLKNREISAHQSAAHFVALMTYADGAELELRIGKMIEELEHVNSDHTFHFRVGVDRIEAESRDGRNTIKRKRIDIEKEYNNAGAARATITGDDSAIAYFDEKIVEEQKWIEMINESQEKALENEEFLVYYQPKYDPRTNRLAGAEALIRWNSPAHGLISPGKFIPLFEKNGFITKIDHYMLRHVAHDQKKWLDEGRECVPVSVNVSRAHFIEEDLAEQIRDIVDEVGTPCDLIEIELTESAFFDDKNALISTLEKLKGYGFTVSMDDFGSGYSSLNSLKEMPLDVLKLDADFFRNDSGERGHIVVAEAIKLAKRLDMRTVAEGVEAREQVDFLAEEGCDMIQGFYFAKPMPGNEFEEKMDQGRAEEKS